MHEDRTSHAGADGGSSRSSAISRKISWNICRGIATSAIWTATQRPWLTTFAPVLMSFKVIVATIPPKVRVQAIIAKVKALARVGRIKVRYAPRSPAVLWALRASLIVPMTFAVRSTLYVILAPRAQGGTHAVHGRF